MKVFLIIEQVVIGCTTAFFWFGSSDSLFRLFQDRKSDYNAFLWPYIVGFITFPYLAALCYKVSWDYLEEDRMHSALYLSGVPLLIFLLVRYIYFLARRN